MTNEQEKLVLQILTKLADVEPIQITEYGETYNECFFCRELAPSHKDDCIVLLAKKLSESNLSAHTDDGT